MTLDVQLRPMQPGDRNYILSSWLRSYAEAPEFARMKRATFFALYEPVVKDLIDRSEVTVATMPEADDVVLGWRALEGDVLHYALAKPRWRKLGIARRLVADLREQPIRYTHQPPPRIVLPASWAYDPDARFRKVAA